MLLLSHIIDEKTPLYGGEKAIRFADDKKIERGDSCNSMRWQLPNHCGTHLDAPAHFLNTGRTIESFSPAELIFCRVCLFEVKDCVPNQIIATADLIGAGDCDLLLIKTNFEKYRSSEKYWQESPGLHPELAVLLKGICPSIRAIGVDLISVSSLANRKLGREAHRAILGENINLIEDMKLSELDSAPDRVIVLPLMVRSADAAPCTVLALDKTEIL